MQGVAQAFARIVKKPRKKNLLQEHDNAKTHRSTEQKQGLHAEPVVGASANREPAKRGAASGGGAVGSSSVGSSSVGSSFGESSSVAELRHAGTLSLLALCSRLLGYVRDMLLAFLLGATPLADLLFLALAVPNSVRKLFAEGALSMGTVQSLVQAKARGGAGEAENLGRTLFFWGAGVSLLTALLCVFVAHPVASLLGAGLSENGAPEAFSLLVELVRITLPFLSCMVLAALAMGYLHSKSAFAAPALAPVLLNAVQIAVALGFCVLGMAGLSGTAQNLSVVRGMAWAFLAGGVVQVLYLWYQCARHGFVWRGAWQLALPLSQVRALFVESGRGVLAASCYYLCLLTAFFCAAFLPAGSVSAFYFAERFMQLPLGLFSVCLGMVALPLLSACSVSASCSEEFCARAAQSLRLTLFFCLPAAAGLAALAEPLLRAVLSYGAFTEDALWQSVQLLWILCAGLPAWVLVRPLVAAAVAAKACGTRALRVAPVSAVAVSVGGAFAALPLFGALAPALGMSLAGWAEAVLLLFFLQRSGVRLARRSVLCPAVFLYALFSCAMLCGVWWAQIFLGGGVFSLAVTVPAAALLYGAVTLALPFGEARLVWHALRQKTS